MAGFADNYVPVNERVEQFLAEFPDGRIQTEIAHLSDTLVVMKAVAYRTADDARPSIAHSQLGIPGKTNFTRDSEVENAETSAVGRALAFMGFETKRGIASREEVQSRQAPRMPREIEDLAAAIEGRGTSEEEWKKLLTLMPKVHVTGPMIAPAIGGVFARPYFEEWLAGNQTRTAQGLIDSVAGVGA